MKAERSDPTAPRHHHTVMDQRRYGDMAACWYPQKLEIPGSTCREAENVATSLSNYFPGCDYLYVVAQHSFSKEEDRCPEPFEVKL